MATTLQILSAKQQKTFDSIPKFNNEERQAFFEMNADAYRYFRRLRTTDNKTSFLLQYGYFIAKGRFFEARQYRCADIKYIHKMYNLPWSDKYNDVKNYEALYGGASSLRHREKILEFRGWSHINESGMDTLHETAKWHTAKQTNPSDVLWALHSKCIDMQWVVPSYHVFSQIVGKSAQTFETNTIDNLKQLLPSSNINSLNTLLTTHDGSISVLTKIKRINQSSRQQSLNRNAVILSNLKQFFLDNQTVIKELQLTDSAINYYSSWVLKAPTFQVKQYKDPYKAYLYLIAFIQCQFFKRQDAAVKGFLDKVSKSLKRALNKAKNYEEKQKSKKNKAIDAVSESQKALTRLVSEIIRITEDSLLTDQRKIEIIRNQAIEAIDAQDDGFIKKSEFLDDYREKERQDFMLLEGLIEESTSLIRSLSQTLQLLVFDKVNSSAYIMEAISYYQSKKGKVGENAPTQFLTAKEKKAVFSEGHINKKLYKVFLYIHIAECIKSGKLSLNYSFEYRDINDYMISVAQFEQEKGSILRTTNLLKYKNCQQHLDYLKEKLEDTYIKVNERFSAGHNGYLFMRPSGKFHVKTPAINHEQSKYISTLLSSDDEISIIHILMEMDRICDYTSSFKHHSNSKVIKEAKEKVIVAGIMGLGCNIGTHKMAKKSHGIQNKILLDTVNWRFSKQNLQAANKKIVDKIESIDLPNIFKIDENHLLTSSDGKKITVAVDSLIASRSYKYYGKEQGVAMYTFINEKQSLFHSTVFASSDREAMYLIDGLLNNTTDTRHIHTTDTHGYTETIFAATHLLGISFAPRFKSIEDQYIYSFHTKEKYKNKDYRVLPTRKIKTEIIEDSWDDILRLMASVILGHCSASQIFKRLNSYAKDHPLYQALKELGRIPKSQHILNYYDDLEFRQRIQKQLNVVELSNKFSDAVFWDRGKQFYVGTKEEQEIQILCKSLMQNAIILWNYLFLTKHLSSTKNKQDEEDMLDSIKKGSVLSWRHVNFTGSYDFTKTSSKIGQFNYEKLKKLNFKKNRRAKQ